MIAEDLKNHDSLQDAKAAVEANAQASQSECHTVYNFPDGSRLEVRSFQGQPATVEAFASPEMTDG